MRRYDVPRHMLAIGLAAQAGFIDALGFLKLGGLFVSFMSGNSTRLGAGIASHRAVAWTAAGLIGAFVGGVVAGALVARRAGPWRKQAVLGLSTLLLLCAALLTLSGEPGNGLTFLMAAAMGAVNNMFQRDGEVSIGVTYMTGALVKLGQQLSVALTRGRQVELAAPSVALAGAGGRSGCGRMALHPDGSACALDRDGLFGAAALVELPPWTSGLGMTKASA
jgi:uncharacterized membrane protein YoaK (UPF0700 family)